MTTLWLVTMPGCVGQRAAVVVAASPRDAIRLAADHDPARREAWYAEASARPLGSTDAHEGVILSTSG